MLAVGNSQLTDFSNLAATVTLQMQYLSLEAYISCCIDVGTEHLKLLTTAITGSLIGADAVREHA